MRIQAWLKHPVITMKPHDSARHAGEVMEKLPVVVDGHLVGIPPHGRDLRDAFPSVFESAEPFARRTRRAGADPATIQVEDMMTSAVLTLAPPFVANAARLMRRERIGAIPIVEGGRLVGILTRSDVLDAFVELSHSALPSG
jgi:acetoin utilization protein AcuB